MQIAMHVVNKSLFTSTSVYSYFCNCTYIFVCTSCVMSFVQPPQRQCVPFLPNVLLPEKNGLSNVPSSKFSVALQAIDNRLEHLKTASLQSSYSKQKCLLRTEFETFLVSLPNSKTILLISRLAFKTIDSYIGKLRAMFKETGRCGEWNSMLGLGNPAASLEVQKYLKASTEQQLRARITPKQAVPLSLPKLLLLARFLNRKIAEHSVNPSSLFVLTQEQAFFKALFFNGECGSDLGMVRTEEILSFPQDDRLLFNHGGKKP